MPYQIQEHFISEYPLWVQYEQSEDFKFLDRQRNYLAPHGNKVLLQAEIQITFPDFRQWLICLRRDKILAAEEITSEVKKKVNSDDFGTLITQNAYNVRVAFNNGSSYIQLLLLAGRKQSK